MTDSLKKDIIQISDYSKYLEQVKIYYNLKNKYSTHKQTYINKLINSDDSIELKKKLYSKNKFKCVNCGKVGGTIFFENNKILRATCGVSTNPCKLNLEIIKMTPILIHNELRETNIILNNIKKKIILTKLDFLFGYIQEDKAVELFENLKSDLGTNQEKYNNLYTLYNSITNNTDINDLIDEKVSEQNLLINDYKELMNLYKETNESKYLKDALFLYTSKLKQLDEHINTLKYKHYTVELNEENKYLIQNKYNINNLELIKKPE
tara:strand:- start:2932 stop:3726 length:795 start_codon:yes stop_codon:yes gene_type:complete